MHEVNAIIEGVKRSQCGDGHRDTVVRAGGTARHALQLMTKSLLTLSARMQVKPRLWTAGLRIAVRQSLVCEPIHMRPCSDHLWNVP